MSDGSDVTATPQRESEEYTYRKLIRPSLASSDVRGAQRITPGNGGDVHGEDNGHAASPRPGRPEPGNDVRADTANYQRTGGAAIQADSALRDAQPLNTGGALPRDQNRKMTGENRFPANGGTPARPRAERGENSNGGRNHQKHQPRPENFAARKVPPPEQTHAESFYYQKQMQAKTTVVVVMQDGEELEGIIEWYDKNCIKMNRIDEPNVVVYKRNIKYLFKADEAEPQ